MEYCIEVACFVMTFECVVIAVLYCIALVCVDGLLCEYCGGVVCDDVGLRSRVYIDGVYGVFFLP